MGVSSLTVAADTWLSPTTRAVAIDFYMFSPNLQLFAAVRLHTTFTTTGGAFSVAHVRTFTKSNDRFPPSRLFQLILAAHICIEIFMLSKEAVRRGWAVFRNGWFLFELFSFAEFVILLCFDIYAYSFMQDVSA